MNCLEKQNRTRRDFDFRVFPWLSGYRSLWFSMFIFLISRPSLEELRACLVWVLTMHPRSAKIKVVESSSSSTEHRFPELDQSWMAAAINHRCLLLSQMLGIRPWAVSWTYHVQDIRIMELHSERRTQALPVSCCTFWGFEQLLQWMKREKYLLWQERSCMCLSRSRCSEGTIQRKYTSR